MKKIIFFVFALSVVMGTKAQQMPEHLLKLMYTGNIISNFYVDSPDNDKIAEEAVKAMLKELDPHSTYTDKKET